jgi:hypothetical protein
VKFSLLLSLLLLISCGKSTSDEQVEEGLMVPSDKALDLAGDVPPHATLFATQLSLINFDQTQERKVLQAAELVREVIGTREFRNAVINHTFNGQKTFVDNQGLSNTQIYLMILQGAERLSPAPNNTMDVELELYYSSTTTIGYTRQSTSRIWMNTKYFDNYEPYQVAGNLTHEWLHKLGFTHSANYTSSRPYSVPYALGYIIRTMARELYTP